MFVHPLVRASVYDAVPDVERHEAHRRAASLLAINGAPIEAVATHLSGLPPAGDSEVASTLQAAAAGALSRAAPDEAVAWLERALGEQAASPPRDELFEQLGMAMAIGRDPAAVGALREAHELAVEPGMRTRTGVVLAELLAHSGQWRAALSVVESIEAGLDPADSEHRAEVAAIKGAVTLFDPRASTSSIVAGPSMRSSPNSITGRLMRWRRCSPSRRSCGDVREEALAFAERALEGGRLLSERGAGSWVTPNLLSVLVQCDELDLVLVVLDEVDAAARASGSVVGLMTTLVYRVWMHARLGDLAAAEGDLTGVFALAREAGLLMGLTTASFLLVDVLLERENVAHIEQMLEQMELPADFLATISGAMLLETRGRLRLLRRDQVAGIDDLPVRWSHVLGHAFWSGVLNLALFPGAGLARCRSERGPASGYRGGRALARDRTRASVGHLAAHARSA